MTLQKHPTWDILDSSKLKCFMTCPRQYFYQYILGWRLDTPNTHLVFGQAWHEAMEHILLHGKDEQAIQGAYEKFLAKYREHFPEETDESRAPKTPENVLRGLVEYCNKYDGDAFEVLYTEVAGTVPIDERRLLHWRMDNISRNKEKGIFSLEHKTAYTLDSKWQDSWQLSIQTGLYLHVLYCIYSVEDVWGILINGACFRNAPRIKKDGTPYATDRGNEFLRVPIQKTKEMMQVWMWTMQHYLDMLEWNMEQLSESKVDDPVMMAFPCNTENCTKYGRCPYMDFCTSWANPLQRCHDIPYGFVEEWWDPKEGETTANKVFHLEKKEEEQ
jgi:hypothetical protein